MAKVVKKKVDAKKMSKGKLALIGLAFAAWVGGVFIVAQFVVILIFRLLPLDGVSDSVLNSILNLLIYVLALVVMILVPWKVLGMKTTREELGLRDLPTWTDILLAPIFYIAVMVIAYIVGMILAAFWPEVWAQKQGLPFDLSIKTNFLDFMCAFLCLGLLAPVCEEIIFRGWLYGKLRARMAAPLAIFIVSLLFGIVHGQVNVGVTVFFLSIGLCIARELTGTIWCGILVHMILNCLAFYMRFCVGIGW